MNSKKNSNKNKLNLKLPPGAVETNDTLNIDGTNE